MVKAACEGMIDFSQADILDPNWWLRLTLVLDYAGRKVNAALQGHKLAINLAVLDYGVEAAAFNKHWEQANYIRNQLIKAEAPWIIVGPTDLRSAAKAMRAQYVERFNDPDDPGYKLEVQKLVDHWEARRKQNKGRRDDIRSL